VKNRIDVCKVRLSEHGQSQSGVFELHWQYCIIIGDRCMDSNENIDLTCQHYSYVKLDFEHAVEIDYRHTLTLFPEKSVWWCERVARLMKQAAIRRRLEDLLRGLDI